MSNYFSLSTNEPGVSALVLENGSTSTGYLRPRGAEWGMFDIETIASESIDTWGSARVGASVAAREVRLPVIVEGSGSHSTLISRWSSLVQMVRSISRSGGTAKQRSNNATGVVRFTLESARLEGDVWGSLAELGACVQVTLVLWVAPATLTDLDVYDDFATDTLGTGGVYNIGGADWTNRVSANTPTISGGVWLTATTTGATVYTHTGTNLTPGDAQATVKVKWNTIAANKAASVVLKYVDSSNYLYVDALSDGAGAGTLAVYKVVDGTATSMASTAITTLATATNYWVRGRVEGGVVYAEWWASEPTPQGSPTHSTSDYLDATETRYFGADVRGGVGIRWNTQGTGTITFDEFRMQAFTYRSATLPTVIPTAGTVPGDIEARADITVTATGSSASAAPNWALMAWMPRPAKTSLVWNGGFEANDANGWSVSAVTGVQTNAGTSIASDTTWARTGSYSGKVITPASTSSGANFPMYGEFKKGEQYVAVLWAYAPSSTTSMVLKLGVNGDVATSGARALTTEGRLYAVTWTPTASVNVAYLSFQTNAATATTCYIDDVMVFKLRDVKNVYSTASDLDPVAYFRLGESSGNVSSSVGSYTGTANGNPTYGKPGPIPGDSTTCMDLDGTGDYVEVSYAAALNPSLISCEAWVMRDTDTGGVEIIAGALNTAGTNGYRLAVLSTDNVEWRLGDGAAGSAVSTVTTLSTGVWYHVVGTFDGTTSRIYLNGHLEAAAADAYAANTTTSFRIGISASSNAAFNGKMANVRIYNRALTDEEVLRRYAGELPALKEGAAPPFGVIDAASVDVTNKGAYFTVSSDANYRSGYKLAGSGSMTTTATAEWYLAPWAVTPDDYARGEYAVKVFARVEFASTQTTVNAVASLRPEGGTSYGAERYTQEWGTSGKSLTSPSSGTPFRLHCLGTLVMRVDRNRPKRWKLRLSITNNSSSTGAFGIDYLVLVPARRFVSNITGVANSDYTAFISSTSQTSKTIAWNKRCEISNPASAVSRYPYPDGGVGGANILIPPGDVDVLAWLADYQPDRSDSNSAGAGKSVSTTVGVSVSPQYVFARA